MRTTANTLAAVSALCFITFAQIDTAQAVGFDCGKASTKIEHIICDDPEISKLDEELNTSYLELLRVDRAQADSHKQSQRQWMKGRDACEDTGCVGEVYISRLKAINALLRATPGYKPPHRFTVTQGKGWTVCESYARYLNAQPESTPLPLCHIPRYPDFPNLKEPDWEVLDIRSNLALVYELEKLTSPSYHDRPVDTFNHWKVVFEQQIKEGIASPRLRRSQLKLLSDGPVETILAYEPDKDKCDRDMRRQGYADYGSQTKLFLWDEREHHIDKSRFYIGHAFELLLFQGRPLLFFPYWGGGMYPHFVGGIDVFQFISAGVGNQYGRVPRCTISFDLPETIIERMTK
ncbi:MAG: hypothetical protein PHF20_05810 [Halothiobacillaceae bacterium]|nr:hypothetical protein [Halothiobacillaceae bacterium]